MMILPQCFSCRHLDRAAEGVMRCPAFPGEIPMEIALNRFEHTRPYPGQADPEILFAPEDRDADPGDDLGDEEFDLDDE